MTEKEEKALGPDKLHRIIPRHFLIDLDKEGLADATREEILEPSFWQEGAGQLMFGDIVSLSRKNWPTLDILILQPHPDGFLVSDISGCFCKPASEAAA